MNRIELSSRMDLQRKTEVRIIEPLNSNLGCCEIIGAKLGVILKDPAIEKLKVNGKWHVWTDFDGVFTNPWNELETFEDLNSFQKVIELSDELTVSTAKTFIDSTNPFYHVLTSPRVRKSPLGFFVYSREKFDHFLDLAHKKNPQCKIKILSGLQKLYSRKDWFTQFTVIKDSLADGDTTIVIGSSILDKRRMFDLVSWLKKGDEIDLHNLYYLNTNHIII